MVKIADTTNSKVRASTILEVVISMVIIVFVIGISLMIFSNVMRLSLSGKKLQANALVQQELLRSANGGYIMDSTYQANHFRVEKTIKPSELGKNLIIVNVTAFDVNNVQVVEAKSLIIHEER